MAQRDRADKPADYQQDIAHLLPAELTAIYIAVKGLIPSQGNNFYESMTWFSILVGTAIVLAILFYFIMPQIISISGRSQRILYCVTFIVWTMATEADHLSVILDLQGPQYLKNELAPQIVKTLINLFAAIWSFGVPYLFRRINPSPPA